MSYQPWKKTTESLHARSGDPACWKPLSDEQRDEVLDWFLEELEDEKRARERLNSEHSRGSVFAMAVFGVLYGYFESGQELSLRFLWYSFSAFVVYSVGFFLLGKIYKYISDAFRRNK